MSEGTWTWFGQTPSLHSRVREEDLRRPVTGYSKATYKDAPDTYSTVSEGFRAGFKRSTSDTVVPQFLSRSRKGEIFNNPFSSLFVERTDSPPPFWRWDTTALTPSPGSQLSGEGLNSRGQLKDPDGAVPGTWDYIDPTDVGSLETLAGTKAWASVQEPEFDAPVFMAEAAETYRMLVRPWDSLWTWLLKSLKAKGHLSRRDKSGSFGIGKYRFDEGLAAAQLLSSNWLAYRYGIKPLLEDIEDAIGILANEPTFGKRHTARGRAESNPYHWERSNPISDSFFTGESYVSYDRSVSVRAGILYTYNVNTYSRTGLNITALPRAAWEAVPFSFVADWVANVGDVLAALESKAACTVLAQWTTVRDVKVWHSEVRKSTPKVRSDVTTTGSLNHSAHKREVLHFRSPGTQVGFAKRTQILDLSKEKWRNRALDVAAFASGFVHATKTPGR